MIDNSVGYTVEVISVTGKMLTFASVTVFILVREPCEKISVLERICYSVHNGRQQRLNRLRSKTFIESMASLDLPIDVSVREEPMFFSLTIAVHLSFVLVDKILEMRQIYEKTAYDFMWNPGKTESLRFPTLIRDLQLTETDIRGALQGFKALKHCDLGQRLITDFEDLLEQVVRLRVMIQESSAVITGSLSLEASKQSVLESKKLGRVTLMAWVFIPVSLISSIFGMNVKEFSSQPPIWLLFAISVPVIVAAVVLELWFVASRERRTSIIDWVKFKNRSRVLDKAGREWFIYDEDGRPGRGKRRNPVIDLQKLYQRDRVLDKLRQNAVVIDENSVLFNENSPLANRGHLTSLFDWMKYKSALGGWITRQ